MSSSEDSRLTTPIRLIVEPVQLPPASQGKPGSLSSTLSFARVTPLALTVTSESSLAPLGSDSIGELIKAIKELVEA